MKNDKTNQVYSCVALTFGLLVMMSLIPRFAQARTFDFKTEGFATYLYGTYGPSLVSDTAYANSSGSGTSVDKKTSTNYSGEFGFLISGETVSLRLGAEVIKPKTNSDIKGTDSSGNQIFNLESSVFAFIPRATIEYAIGSTPHSRWLATLGAGVAVVTVDNTYTQVASSTGLTDHVESGTGTGTMIEIATAYEFLLSDTATMFWNIGYRRVSPAAFQSNKDVTSFMGSEPKDSDLKNQDGSNRTVNLSGPFAGVAFRFYF